MGGVPSQHLGASPPLLCDAGMRLQFRHLHGSDRRGKSALQWCARSRLAAARGSGGISSMYINIPEELAVDGLVAESRQHVKVESAPPV